MSNYKEKRVKLTTQLNWLRYVTKNKTGKTLRRSKKKWQDEQFPHELFVTTRQKVKIGSPFANNISTDIKLNKGKFTKITQ